MSIDNKIPRRPRPGQNPGITVEKYDEIYRAYRTDQQIAKVAERCGVDRRTVKRYVEFGDPGRGLRPIRERFAETIRKVQELEDNDLARARADSLRLVREQKDVFAAKLKELYGPDGETLTAEASANLGADLAASLERIVRLELSLLGEPDLKIQTTNMFDGWSQDDIIAYGATGKLPGGRKKERKKK